MERWIIEVARYRKADTKVIVIGCKMDLISEDRVVSRERVKEFCLKMENREGNVVFGGECSGKSGKGVEEMMILAMHHFFEKFSQCSRCGCPVTP